MTSQECGQIDVNNVLPTHLLPAEWVFNFCYQDALEHAFYLVFTILILAHLNEQMNYFILSW